MRYKPIDFINAIPGSGGIIDTIRRRVGCQWHTAKKYIETHAVVKKAYEDEIERVTDMAHSVVINAISHDDVATAKWYLSKKRKEEFGDQLDITSAGEPIVFKVIKRGTND